jgi:type II secretory pathway component GspD/PulD (secretin)
MKSHFDAAATRGFSPACISAACKFAALTLACLATSAVAHAQSADIKAADTKPSNEIYQTLYLTNLTQQSDLNEIQSDLRNMLPKAHLYGMPSQNAISIRATPEDIQIAQKILADLDRGKKLYRLTYTINESDSGKHTGTQSFTLIVASGGKTTFKQGSRVPIVTGSYDSAASTSNTQVQYQDVGLAIEASADSNLDGLRLRSKVEQTKVADEKSGVGTQDPIVRQTVLDGTSTLATGKPLILGSLDVPGTMRKQEIEVVAELVK